MKSLCFTIPVFWFIVMIFSSCEKIIDVDLNSSSPRTVIEATISDEPGPYTVRLSKSVNFNETNSFPPISGATVELSDDAGNTEILAETAPGFYVTSTFPQGVPGRTYSLSVTAGGQQYNSTSVMPLPVEIDTVTTITAFDGTKRVNVKFQDPPGIENFYRLIEIQNGKMHYDIEVDNDRFRDGDLISQNLFGFNSEDSTELITGDTVIIMMQSIDKGAHEYFRTLSQILGEGQQSASPANPLPNISNNALGYFSAYSVRSKELVW